MKIKESSGKYGLRVNVSTSFCFSFPCLLSIMDWVFSSSHPAITGGVIDRNAFHFFENCGFNKRLYIKYILPWTHAMDKNTVEPQGPEEFRVNK